MDTGVVISIILAVLGVAITVVIWIASTRAVKYQQTQDAVDTHSRKVDEDAYSRAKQIYEGAIDQLESEVARLRAQATDLTLEVSKLNAEIIRIRKKGYNGLDDSGL